MRDVRRLCLNLLALTAGACLAGCASTASRPPASAPIRLAPLEAPTLEAGPGEVAITLDPAVSRFSFEGTNQAGPRVVELRRFAAAAVMTLNGDPLAVRFKVDMSSFATADPELERFLRSADGLDLAAYPEASFESRSIRPTDARRFTHLVLGDLSVRGVTRVLAFPVALSRSAEEIAVRSAFTFDRDDFGAPPTGDPADLEERQLMLRIDLVFKP